MQTRDEAEALESRVRGSVVGPGDTGYDEARSVWNGMVDRRPAAIVRCADVEDVRAALAHARRRGVGVSVRGGGHQVAGSALCDGGIVLDMRDMADVRVDPERRSARVGPGARWRDFDRAAQAHGLATTGGVHSGTGVAGLTLGGGVGYLARRFGLAADNLTEADVVLADGTLVTASEKEHPELFWGLRGGGAGLGVVTSFEFALHAVGPEVMTVQAFFPYDELGQALAAYRAFAAEAPDEVACYAMILKIPPVDPFPHEHHGAVSLAVVGCHTGDLEAGHAALAPVERFGTPLLAATQAMPYVDWQQAFDAGVPDGGRYYYKAQFLDDLSDGLIAELVDRLHALPGAYTIVGIEPLGGAIARVDPEATAFPHRTVRYNLSAWTGWIEPGDDAENIAWTRSFHSAIAPHAANGVYANYLDRDDADRVEAAFGPNLARLTRLKATFDPDGLFRADPGPQPGAGHARHA